MYFRDYSFVNCSSWSCNASIIYIKLIYSKGLQWLQLFLTQQFVIYMLRFVFRSRLTKIIQWLSFIVTSVNYRNIR